MSRDETERYMNIQVDTLRWKGRNGSSLSFLYPAIYTITCRLNIRFFPYDQQNCTLTISSWTNSKSAVDYYADPEYKYACCPEPWVILQASLVIQRKPLYYIVNLIIPTSIITIVAITGFFTPASTDDDRTEKINLGITTLLAMSILMLMVSDQMPTTSEFVPLIAWFYLSIIFIVSIGTFLTSVVLSVQGRRQYGRNPPKLVRYWFFIVMPHFLFLTVPPTLEKLWGELDDDPMNMWRRKRRQKKQLAESREQVPTSPGNNLLVPNSAGVDQKNQNQMQMIDISAPNSPQSLLSRQPSGKGLWEGTMSVIAGTNTQLRRTSAVYNKEVDDMKRKRQCSLEWEYLATVLDRFLLILFISAVFLVTCGLILVGKMAQYSYENPNDAYFTLI